MIRLYGRKWIPALIVLLITAGPVAATLSAQSQQSVVLADILRKAGKRVDRYPDGLLSVVCTELSRQQELEPDLKTSKKKPTELVYDFMIVRPQSGFGLSERRELKLIDGKPAGSDSRPSIPDPTAFAFLHQLQAVQQRERLEGAIAERISS